MKTLVIDNFKGSMTAYQEGEINSGFSFIQNTAGVNPFKKPGNLTFSSAAVQIDAAGSIITDLIMAGKERVESGILYVYAIGSSGRVYKIQVNKPSTNDPNFDTPVLLATITSGTPTFTRGGYIDFFGATERIYIGHDKGVTRIDFDGMNETAVAGTWTQTVPRPLKQFLGKLYIGNGANIAEIDTTATQTTATKLAPGFPTNSQVRDIDVTSDGNYLQIVVSSLALPDILAVTQDTVQTASMGSFVFKWNGTDTGYTSYDTFPTFSLTANTTFQNSQYTFGYDLIGGAVYNPTDKLLSLQEVQSPLPNAISSTGNIVSWMTPLWYQGFMEADIFMYGSLDFEVGPGFWDVFFQYSSGSDTDIIQVPFQMPVSNFGLGASSNGYTDNIFGTSKMYFSTLEINGATPHYKFWKWILITSPNIPDTAEPIFEAVYQTQTQLFSKKQEIKEVRIYSEPWVDGNIFKLDLIGSGGTAMTGGSKTFTAQNSNASAPMYIGTDYVWWNPTMAPTYALGLWVENQGTTNFTISKIEVDYQEGGK
jgi:hypothetical protein